MPKTLTSQLFWEILKDRPVAYWPCNDYYASFNNVPKEVADRVTLTNGNQGHAWNAITLIRGEHKFFTVNGSGWFVGPTGAPFSSDAGASGVMSIECLVSIGTLSNDQWLITKGGNGSNYEYSFAVMANGAAYWKVHTLAGADVVAVNAAAGSLRAGTPYLMLATYDRAGALAIIYVNGVEVARSTTFSGNSSAGTAQYQIGHRQDGNGATITAGSGLGHVAHYDYVLSPGRIRKHYQALLRQTGYR